MPAQIIVNGLTTGAAYALLALSFSLILSVTRVFHFAYASILTAAIFLASLLIEDLGFHSLAAALAAVVFAAVLAALMAWGAYEPFIRRRTGFLSLLLVSVGIHTIIQAAIAMVFRNRVVAFAMRDLPFINSRLRIGGIAMTGNDLVNLGTAVVLFLAFLYFFTRTKLGVAMRALANDPEMAEIVGINAPLVRVVALAVGSALAAVAGLLLSLKQGVVDPNIGFHAMMFATVATIVSGVGNVPAAAVGGWVLAMLQSFAGWYILPTVQEPVVFLVLVVVLMFRSQGLFGRRISKVGR